jgi:hypothetical protein
MPPAADSDLDPHGVSITRARARSSAAVAHRSPPRQQQQQEEEAFSPELRMGNRALDLELRVQASRAFPCCARSILTEMYLFTHVTPVLVTE